MPDVVLSRGVKINEAWAQYANNSQTHSNKNAAWQRSECCSWSRAACHESWLCCLLSMTPNFSAPYWDNTVPVPLHCCKNNRNSTYLANTRAREFIASSQGHPGHSWTFNGTPSLYHLDASSTSSPQLWPTKMPPHFAPGGQNQSQLGTTDRNHLELTWHTVRLNNCYLLLSLLLEIARGTDIEEQGLEG